jgi:hypothetical protein
MIEKLNSARASWQVFDVTASPERINRVMAEIDVSVAGQSSTYIFNCVRDRELTVIQPMGMR